MITRRQILLSLPCTAGLLRAGSLWAGPAAPPAIERFLFVNLAGGPSQMDLWDPKPKATNGGGVKTLSTAIPDTIFAEALGPLAEHSANMALVHTTSRIGEHALGSFFVGSGGFIPNPAQANPGMAAVCGWILSKQDLRSELPRVVGIGGALSSGFLGPDFDPYAATPGSNRLAARERERAALEQADAMLADYAELSPFTGTDQFQKERAYSEQAARLTLGDSNKVFDLDNESAKAKNDYGPGIGQSFLLARRLFMAGVPSIQITQGGWDTHNDNKARCERLGSTMAKGLASLIADLKALGLYESTLILVGGEFGRSPGLNGMDGRDHYPANNPMLLAGGSLQPRRIGISNADGTKLTGGITIAELAFSLYQRMGKNPKSHFMHKSGRPLRFCPADKGIEGLL